MFAGLLRNVCGCPTLQPHLPSTQVFQKHSIYLNIGDSQSVKLFAEALARLGYAEVKEVKESKQWSRKGFSFEVFPINRNLPVRLSCNRGTVEKIREFDPTNPKSFTDLSNVAIGAGWLSLVKGYNLYIVVITANGGKEEVLFN